MVIPSKFVPHGRQVDGPALRNKAPSPHIEALLRALEATDEQLTPLTQHGMDGRTATILKEIEKTGAIYLRSEDDNLWIDVIDRKKALSVIDKLMAELKR